MLQTTERAGRLFAMPFPANRLLGVAFVGRNHVQSNARSLGDCVLRVRVLPALCEQLTNMVQLG
jgi:hypothetical protein